MMDRRAFLQRLGLGALAAAAPTKAYSFLGNILRRPSWFDDGIADWKPSADGSLVQVRWALVYSDGVVQGPFRRDEIFTAVDGPAYGRVEARLRIKNQKLFGQAVKEVNLPCPLVPVFVGICDTLKLEWPDPAYRLV